MTLIECTSDCIYQQDGTCRLQRAMSSGVPSYDHPCVNYVPKSSQQSGQGLPDVPHPDEL